jgi:hypothetical protein
VYGYVLYGWAADSSTPGQALHIHIYVNGKKKDDTVDSRYLVTSESRPDVAAVYPWAGPNTGFSLPLSSDRQSTPETVCAYAINEGAGTANTGLGCVQLPASGTDGHEPIGAIDEVRVAPGLLHLRGWAGDRDAGSETVEVRVYYDVTPMLSMLGDQPRPDVPTVFPELDGTTGFDQDLPIPPGLHRVCAYAGNLGKGGLQNSTIGCIIVDVPGPSPAGPHDPQGNQERIRVSTDVTGQLEYFDAVGWAFDPDTTGPWTVRFLTVAAASCCYPLTKPIFQTTGTTDQSRPDVQAAFPAAGPRAGYQVRLPPGGQFQYVALVCAYARQEGSGTNAERFIGCSNTGDTTS